MAKDRFSDLERRILVLEKRVSELENIDDNLFWFDEVSELFWEIKKNRNTLFNYFEAENYIESLNNSIYGNFSNWRFPTKSELETIFYKNENNFLKEDLQQNISKDLKPIFWSSTEDKNLKWVAYFNHGYGDFKYQTHNYYLMAVRNF